MMDRSTYGSLRLRSLLLPVLLVSGCALSAQAPAHKLRKPVPAAQTAATTAAANTANVTMDAMPSFDSKVSNEAATHIVVGQAMFINTKQRLKRVYITDPAVIDSYTATPNQLLVTAKSPGESSLVVWDETGASQAYLISADVDITRLRQALKDAMPHEEVTAQSNGERILLTGTVSTNDLAQQAVKLAGLYSKDVSNALVTNSSRAKQVQLKVRIIEVDRSKLDQFGFNFFSGGGNNVAQTTTTQFPSIPSVSGAGGSGGAASSNSNSAGGKTVSVTNPLNFFFYSSRLNIGATLQDMVNKQVMQILAEPTLTTLSGQEANFLSGGEFPFPVVQGGVGGLTSISIQFRPYGVKVQFLPLVNPDGTIQLKVAPEVSALDFTNAVTITGYVVPAIATRRADTEVVVQNGQTFAISGLLDRRTTDAFGKTPGIANVPILGELFKSKNLNHSTTELLVLVTPTIVDPSTVEVPEAPKTAIDPLDPQSFDKELPTAKGKK